MRTHFSPVAVVGFVGARSLRFAGEADRVWRVEDFRGECLRVQG